MLRAAVACNIVPAMGWGYTEVRRSVLLYLPHVICRPDFQ